MVLGKGSKFQEGIRILKITAEGFTLIRWHLHFREHSGRNGMFLTRAIVLLDSRLCA